MLDNKLKALYDYATVIRPFEVISVNLAFTKQPPANGFLPLRRVYPQFCVLLDQCGGINSIVIGTRAPENNQRQAKVGQLNMCALPIGLTLIAPQFSY